MRDLDDLLDPVVSRRASAAARTPDFAAVERRGQQRRRRARASAVGAVVAVVAVVSVVGTQVASDRADTAPAGTIEWEGPDGDLGRVVESGEAENTGVVVSPHGSLLTTWSYLTDGEIDPREGLPDVSGFTLAIDGQTYWSPLDYTSVEVSQLASDAFVLSLVEKGEDPALPSDYVADVRGIQPLELTQTPADLASGSFEGFAHLIGTREDEFGIYAIDVQTLTASPVAELNDRYLHLDDITHVPQTGDGELWVIDLGSHRLVHMASDGRLSTYPLPPESRRFGDIGMSLRESSMSTDGRPIVLWADGGSDKYGNLIPPMTLLLTSVTGSGTVSTVDLGATPGQAPASAAALTDGRLLVNNGGGLLRSSDVSWRDFEAVAAPEGVPAKRLRTYVLKTIDRAVCLTPSYPSVNYADNRTMLESFCTTDGESWESVDLTP
jgi:hypothetical protein